MDRNKILALYGRPLCVGVRIAILIICVCNLKIALLVFLNLSVNQMWNLMNKTVAEAE
jgi:hypothetical protein